MSIPSYRRIGFPLALLLLLLAAFFWLGHLAKTKITDKLAEIPGLSYEELQLELLGGDLYLRGIRYQPDSNQQLLQITEAQLEGLGYWRLCTSNTVCISRLAIIGLRGNYTALKSPPQPTKKQPSRWRKAHIGELHIQGDSFQLLRPAAWELQFGQLNLHLGDYHYDPDGPLCPKDWRDIQGQFSAVRFQQQDAIYHYQAAQLKLAGPAQQLQLEQLKCLPNYSRADWSEQFSHKKSRLQLEVAQLAIDSFDFERLINGKGISASSLQLAQAQLQVYSDGKKPVCSDCYKPLLHEKLHDINLPIKINQVTLKDSHVKVETWSSRSEQKIALDFTSLYASIYAFDNRAAAQDAPLLLDIQSNVFGSTALALKFSLYHQVPAYPYHYEGSLAAVDLTRLNNILGSGAKAAIRSGRMEEFTFSADGNNTEVTGTAQMRYTGLSVALQNDERQTRRFLSTIVNKLAIQNDSEGLERGTIYYPRDPNHGFFHQVWHSLRSGILEIVLPDMLIKNH